MPAQFHICRTLTLAGASLMAATCSAHPTHVSLTEAQWNAETGSLELVVRLVAEHLEDAVKKSTGHEEFTLEQEKAEEFVQAYVQSRFLIAVDGERPAACQMHWVGMEIKTQDAWVYLEYKLPADWNRLVMQNSLLFDVVPQQSNVVSARVDQQSRTLVFSPDCLKLTLDRDDTAPRGASSP